MSTTRTEPEYPFVLARIRTEPGADSQVAIVVRGKVRGLSDRELLGHNSVNSIISAWPSLSPVLSEIAKGSTAAWSSISEAHFDSPVEPRTILQAGANYKTHVLDIAVAQCSAKGDASQAEIRSQAEAVLDERVRSGAPYLFLGSPSAVVGDDVDLVLPRYGGKPDWELELAAVVGGTAYRVSPQDALSHVVGYTIVNDITMRDLVFRKDMERIGTDWYRSKNAPGFLPAGPFFIPAEFVTDVQNLRISLTLNDEVMQDSTTAEMMFDVAALVSAASQTQPLEAGDLILTGSPAGNGVKWNRQLEDGDVLRGTISGFGEQIVHCIAEDATEAHHA